MAWVNRTCFKEDNMVFGSEAGSGSYLHLGFRRELAYFGTWNGDSGAYVGNIVGIFEWHHWAERYDMTAGTHSIFINGNPVLDQGGAVFPGYGTNLMVGGNFGYAGPGSTDRRCGKLRRRHRTSPCFWRSGVEGRSGCRGRPGPAHSSVNLSKASSGPKTSTVGIRPERP